jgi:hypothetical protein
MDTGTNAPRPVLRLALPGIPDTCGYCGETSEEWPLTVVGHRVHVTCPRCWTVAGPVVAVAQG